MLAELNAAVAERNRLRETLGVLEKSFQGVSADEAARRLTGTVDAEKRLNEGRQRERALQALVDENVKAEQASSTERKKSEIELTKLRSQLAGLPPNIAELESALKHASSQVSILTKQLKTEAAKAAAAAATNAVIQGDRQRLTEQLRQREVGEFSVRRELTGLPDGNLKRVIFLLDTSQSMKDSPAWTAARNLMRTWVEFLPVEECVLVSFNDKATGFPETGYLRVRNPDGTEMRDQRTVLLNAFDQTKGGAFTDLLRGLRHAYAYPRPDVMVLFTDGIPQVNYRTHSAYVRDIYDEVKLHPGIPILTVAVGSYELAGTEALKPQTKAPVFFLKELSRMTGGSFIGR